MTGREQNERLRAAFAEQMPDMLPRIKNTCERTPQIIPGAVSRPRRTARIRALSVAACFLLFFVGMAAGWLWPHEVGTAVSPAETVIYMDVNPSISLELNAEGRVTACRAANADGEALLEGLDLVGVERNTALTAILGAMYVNGYLSAEANSVLISVDGADGTKTEAMLGEITEEINAVFAHSEMTCAIIAQQMDVGEELRARAEEYGVSVGKMHLVEKMIGGIDFLDEQDLEGLSALSIGELNLMYSSQADTEMFDGDIATGFVSGFMELEDAIATLIDAIGLKDLLLEEYEATTGYAVVDGISRLVYEVNIKFKYSENSYRFVVDCETGKVLETDFELGFHW